MPLPQAEQETPHLYLHHKEITAATERLVLERLLVVVEDLQTLVATVRRQLQEMEATGLFPIFLEFLLLTQVEAGAVVYLERLALVEQAEAGQDLFQQLEQVDLLIRVEAEEVAAHLAELGKTAAQVALVLSY